MPTREFLGWERPFLTQAVEWLLERRDELPCMRVVVPTAESGRRLREAMAERAGAVLSPGIATPGSFLKIENQVASVAPDWAELVAWVEVLEKVPDWSAYDALFPEAPQADGEWAGGLAREMLQLRRNLQENAHTLASAAQSLRATVEGGRWEALGRLEAMVEKLLESWGYQSRSRVLAAGLKIPVGLCHIVLAGVVEMPPLVERALLDWEKESNTPPGQRLTVLIGAPEHEAAGFSTSGRPLAAWCDREMPWPEGPQGSVRVAADPRQQAQEALALIGRENSASDAVALGAADVETGAELARALTRGGWPAFHPAAVTVQTGLARWFNVWSEWLADATLSVMADLLTLPETGVLVGGRREQKAECLAHLRARWMLLHTEDLQRRMGGSRFRNEQGKLSAVEVLDAAMMLEKCRERLLGPGFVVEVTGLLELLGSTGSASADMAASLGEWIAQASPVIRRVRRGPRFWIDLMLDDVPVSAPLPPEGRVIDVQGWLELFYEPGRHLVLCGMNEGSVPGRSGGEPWLSETAREKLGLITDAMRVARDAYLFKAMVAARHAGGRVDVLCGKTGGGGETLMPSRLLLAAERAALPLRVRTLFREIEPPEAGLRWHADWQWQARRLDPPKRISVTSIKDYLACPLRYYLKHVLAMQIPEPSRIEWNARDFGSVAHEVLERWGKDEEAREYKSSDPLSKWLAAELERVLSEWFGKRVPMSVRIQAGSLRQRLAWLARVQAEERVAGWQVVDVERKVEIAVGEAMIVAQIDRIDRHCESGELRVIDYKTGKVDAVAKAHRSRIIATSVMPAHLGMDCPAVYEGVENGKPVSYRWINLQLPLYASALVRRDEKLPQPCYFTLGATMGEVAVHRWADFSPEDLRAAEACADWVVANIANRVFSPPAEKVLYDDYRVLTAGRTLQEALAFSIMPDIGR